MRTDVNDRRLFKTDPESGSVLIETVAAACAASIIFLGLITMLHTAFFARMRISADAGRRSAVILVSDLIRDASGKDVISVSDGGDRLLVGEDETAILCEFLELSPAEGSCAVCAGGVVLVDHAARVGAEPVFSLSDDRQLLTVCFAAEGHAHVIALQCPLNGPPEGSSS